MLALERLQHVQPVEPGHGDVEQHQVEPVAPPQRGHLAQHLGAALRLGHHQHVGRLGQHLLEAFAHDAVVVPDQHADGVGQQIKAAGLAVLAVHVTSPGVSTTDSSMCVPRPRLLSIRILPPKCPARSRMPMMP